MASASSSTSIPPQPPSSIYTHDVFLSYRGPDTGNGFTSHLYAALNKLGMRTYKDDQDLRIGDAISKELVKAIEESMFAVIVFSPDFASSGWCLDEVCKIMECKNNQRLQMVEVFYHVEPCDVRHQIGTFREAFEKHEQQGYHESQKIQRWRDALELVTQHSGWTTKDEPNEANLVNKIAQHIFKLWISKSSSSMKNLVGIESRVEHVKSQLDLGFKDVRYIGIWGLGGIGKSTIAKLVFERIRSEFEASCFVADVRQHFEKQDITGLQKQLLKQMNVKKKLSNEYEGSKIIQTSFCRKKVLIVLDDVSHENQLENLAKEKDWFGPGSRIIITTRNKEVLKHQEGHETYAVKALAESEAFNLFCSIGFAKPEHVEGFLHLSKEVVSYCSGLPLALKVLGSYLKGRPIAVWESAIEKINKSSHPEIIDVSRISYDGLDSMEKNIFLHIACFFKGGEKDDVTNTLNGCGLVAEIGIDILINRSLVTLEKGDWIGIYMEMHDVCLGMHDLLEEFGKQIVIQESPNDVSKRSRLWCYKDIDSVLSRNREIEAVKSIALSDETGWDITSDWKAFSFSNICQLNLLILDDVKTQSPCPFTIPSTLKVFSWVGCPMETLPFSNDQHNELVKIVLACSSIVRLWGEEKLKLFNNLEYLDLSYSEKLKQTPDLSGVPILKTLELEGCGDLNDIHPSLANHKSLVVLNLNDCDSLKKVGDKLEMSSLKELKLPSGLERLPEFGECMKQLSILDLFGLSDECDCSGLLSSQGCLAGLRKLVLTRCSVANSILCHTHGLESLTVSGWNDSLTSPRKFWGSLSHLTSLTSLLIRDCLIENEEVEESEEGEDTDCLFSDKEAQEGEEEEETEEGEDLSQLTLLTDLDLSENYFSRVPISIHKLPRLKRLHLSRCGGLEVLPELPSSLRELQATFCNSLDASNVNDVISKACRAFAESATQDPEDILQMCISWDEIPAWFENQEEDNGVSVSFPDNCPSTETLALALCFQFEKSIAIGGASVICNGNEFIKQGLLKIKFADKGDLGIVCMNSYYLSKLLCQHNRFQLSSPRRVVQRCGARWVCKQDIQGFKKRNSETRKRKAILE